MLLVFCTSYHGYIVIYICIKLQTNISKKFQVTEWTQTYYRNNYFQSSKGHNSKCRLTRITVFVFYTLCYNALHLCEFGTVFILQSGHEYIVEIAIFNIYYVQRATTPKVGYPELRFLCSARCLVVFNTCKKLNNNILNGF